MTPKHKIKKKPRSPSLYLDTSIIRSLIEKKLPAHVNLMRTIKDRKWDCFTSTLAILELGDLKKDDIYFNKKIKEKARFKEIIKSRDRKDLIVKELKKVQNYIKNFFEKYPYFLSYQIPAEVWLDSLTITLHSNIHSSDAVHLAAALNFGANVLITSDTHFIKESNNFLKKHRLDKKIKVVLPENIFQTLSDLGFSLDK